MTKEEAVRKIAARLGESEENVGKAIDAGARTPSAVQEWIDDNLFDFADDEEVFDFDDEEYEETSLEKFEKEPEPEDTVKIVLNGQDNIVPCGPDGMLLAAALSEAQIEYTRKSVFILEGSGNVTADVHIPSGSTVFVSKHRGNGHLQ